jgi:hypothetical protein
MSACTERKALSVLSDLDMLNHFGIGRQTKAELYNENRHHVYQN